MKYLILLLSIPTLADEVILGAWTHHFPDNQHMERFVHKLNDNGDILNPAIGYRLTDEDMKSYQSTTMFIGENSIGNGIIGITASSGWKYDSFRIGGTIGGYIQDDKQFLERRLHPFAIPVGDAGLVPMIGLEVGYTIGNTTVYTVLTPVLMTTVVGVSF